MLFFFGDLNETQKKNVKTIKDAFEDSQSEFNYYFFVRFESLWKMCETEKL